MKMLQVICLLGRLGCDTRKEPKICGDMDATNHLGFAMAKSGASAFVQILPYLEEQALSDLFRVDELPIHSNQNDAQWKDWVDGYPNLVQALTQRPSVFACPSDPVEAIPRYAQNVGNGVACGNYAVCAGTCGAGFSCNEFQAEGDTTPPKRINMKYSNDGVFMYAVKMDLRKITDGASKTFFLGETIEVDTIKSPNMWSAGSRGFFIRSTATPLNFPVGVDAGGGLVSQSNGGFASRHPGGALFTFGDGHVEFVSESIDHRAYKEFATRAHGDLPYLP